MIFLNKSKLTDIEFLIFKYFYILEKIIKKNLLKIFTQFNL